MGHSIWCPFGNVEWFHCFFHLEIRSNTINTGIQKETINTIKKSISAFDFVFAYDQCKNKQTRSRFYMTKQHFFIASMLSIQYGAAE